LGTEFQALLSWFSRNRLLLDELTRSQEADGAGFYRHCVIAQAANHSLERPQCPANGDLSRARLIPRPRGQVLKVTVNDL
jgi:hypothetical protein